MQAKAYVTIPVVTPVGGLRDTVLDDDLHRDGNRFVATTIDGVTEVAQHQVTALLVPPKEPAALADAIISLLKDQKLASRLGEAGRKLAEERFALSRTVEEVDRFYSTLLREKGIQ